MVMIVLCAINVQFNFDRTHVGTRWVRSHKEKRWATIGSTTEENVIKGQSIRCHLDRGQNSGWGWLVLEGHTGCIHFFTCLLCILRWQTWSAVPTHTGIHNLGKCCQKIFVPLECGRDGALANPWRPPPLLANPRRPLHISQPERSPTRYKPASKPTRNQTTWHSWLIQARPNQAL